MDVSAVAGFRQRPGWLVVVAALLVGQGWLTLQLFSSDLSFERILNDEPIVSGRHSLHYYHGSIGAKAWEARGTSSCFDAAYQAGYPKTPVFDGGSRPSEFFQIVGGARPASYKLGLALCCLLVPLAFTAIGRGIGLTPGACCLCGLFGAALWWSTPCQALLAAGELDLLLGGLCVLLNVTWFIRFERSPGIDSWLVMTITGTLAWFTQPLLVVGYVPILLLYYLWVATRQGPIWHLAVVAAVVVAFGLNYSWLDEWARSLWLYLPFGCERPPPPALWPSLSREWVALLPTDPVHIGIGAAGLVGLLVMLKVNRPAAWLLGCGALQYVVASAAGKCWPMLAEFGAEKLFVLGVWCLAPSAAYVMAAVAAHLGDASGWRPVGVVWLSLGLLTLVWALGLPKTWLSRPGLEIGLNAERTEVVRVLSEKTTAEARILWEDRGGSGHGWTALLALLAERPFLGGLDPGGHVEHMYARLHDGMLGDKPIADWDDARLRQFIERYNVCWVVCWTPESIQRFRALPMAKPIADLKDGRWGVLFALERKPSYLLKGRARWVEADAVRIALADVEPENGEVVLSAHYQTNLRVSPAFVQIERDLDLDDPIPLIRLRVPGPVSRLSIVWEVP
jgi:hypothetical protein